MEIKLFLSNFFKETRGLEYAELEKVTDLVEAQILDSFMWMNLLMQVEDLFRSELDVDLLVKQRTVTDLLHFIEQAIEISKKSEDIF